MCSNILKQNMKKVKFEAIIKISDDTIIEESMVKRTAGLLGEIESFNVTHDLNSEFKKDHLENSNGSSDPFSQISKLSIMRIKFFMAR